MISQSSFRHILFSSFLPHDAKPEHTRFMPLGVVRRGDDLAKLQLHTEHDLIMKLEMSSAAIAVFARDGIITFDAADSRAGALKSVFRMIGYDVHNDIAVGVQACRAIFIYGRSLMSASRSSMESSLCTLANSFDALSRAPLLLQALASMIFCTYSFGMFRS